MGIEYWLGVFLQTFMTVASLAIVFAWKFGIVTSEIREVRRRLQKLEDRMNGADRRGD